MEVFQFIPGGDLDERSCDEYLSRKMKTKYKLSTGIWGITGFGKLMTGHLE